MRGGDVLTTPYFLNWTAIYIRGGVRNGHPPLSIFGFHIEDNWPRKKGKGNISIYHQTPYPLVYLRYTEPPFIPLISLFQNWQHPALNFARANYARKRKHGKQMPIQTVKMCLVRQWAFIGFFIQFQGNWTHSFSTLIDKTILVSFWEHLLFYTFVFNWLSIAL